jgi:hypothetical protein
MIAVQKELMEKVTDITRACGQIYKLIKKQDEANVDEYKVQQFVLLIYIAKQ